jgi:hypothetical protein
MMSRRGAWLIVGGALAIAAIVGALLMREDSGASAENVDAAAALRGFDASINARQAIGLLHAAADADREGLRKTALAEIGSSNAEVRWAAVYSLALVVKRDDADGISALETALASADLDERLAAADGLVAAGDKSALPVLIELLASRATTRYIVMPVWRWARGLLLVHSTQDFGLRAALDRTSAAATQPAWQAWWNTNANALAWDASTGKFR